MGYIRRICATLISGLVINCALAYTPGDKVMLVTTKTCPACKIAKNILTSYHVPYTETTKKVWAVPQLYVNGKFKGYGIGSVQRYVNE